MEEVLFIVPKGNDNEGEVVPVPAADAEWFDANGWERAEEKTKKTNKR